MITIGFFSNNSFMTNLIQLVTGSRINHVAIGLVKDGKQCWLEASTKGVMIVDRGYLSGLCAEFEVLPDISNEVQLAEQKVGQAYADLIFIGFLFIYIGRLFGIKLHNPFYEKSAEVCSQFVVDVDTQKLIPEFYGLVPADVSPGDASRLNSARIDGSLTISRIAALSLSTTLRGVLAGANRPNQEER